MALRNLLQPMARLYDRMIAVLVLVLLVASLGYLAWHVGTVRSAQESFVKQINGLTIKHPEAAETDVSGYEAAIAAVRVPLVVDSSSWSNRLFVPAMRVWCRECHMPHDYDATVCPFCGTVPQTAPKVVENLDVDNDGMRDAWELANRLDPSNPADAVVDLDGDGFTNREEHDWTPQTDPHSRTSSPPIVAKLCVDRTAALPFRLRFQSVLKLPGGNRKFAINTTDDGRTYFKRLGESVEGFVLDAFEERKERVETGGAPRTVDRSVLTLKRGDKRIRLQIGSKVQYDEYAVRLYFKVEDRRFALKTGGKFTLLEEAFELIRIDSSANRVVIRRLRDGTDFTVSRCGGGDNSGTAP